MLQSSSAKSYGSGRPNQLSLLAVLGGWLMVLPATVFLAAAVLRQFQPRQFQPARAAWMVFEWTQAHITRLDAAVVFLGLPAFVLIAGCSMLWFEWRRNQALRQDAVGALAIARRRFMTIGLAIAVLLAGAILAFVVNHLVVG